MAVTVTDRRTTVTDAESVTDWTGVGYGVTSTDVVEATNAVAESLSSTTGQTYYTQPTGSVNLGTSPGTLVYVYSFNNALQDAWDASPPPQALMLGDGTDQIAFDMAGANRRVFNHLEGPTGWQCLVLDTAEASNMNSAGNTYVVSGSFAGLNFGAITQWGCSFDTNSKALGGGYNVAVDIIRYGNDGIRITAGGSGTEGTFSEIAAADRSTADGAAHGILRAYTTIAFGCQGPLTFGDSGTATDSRFIDTGIVLAYEDRNIANDKYYLNVEGNSGATNVFELYASTVTTAGPWVAMDFNAGNINTFILDAVSFTALGGAINFSDNADATGHTVQDCTFDGCGAIALGSVDFLDNVITGCGQVTAQGGVMTGLTLDGYEGTADTSALIYNEATDPDGYLDNSSFTKGTAATHAIEFGTSSPLTMTLQGVSFSGYNASNGQNDSALHIKRTSGTVTINIAAGGDTPSYKSDGATVSIVNTKNYTMSGMNDGTEITILDRDVEMLDVTGTATDLSFGDAAATERMGQSFQVGATANAERVRIRIRKVGTPTDGVTIRLVNGVPGSTLLAESVPLSGADITTSYVEYDIDLTEKNSLTASTTYGIEIQRTGAVDAANYYQIEYSTTDVHASGTRYVYNAGWGTASGDLLFTLMEAASDNTLFHVESSSGSETYSHGGVVKEIEILAVHIDYRPLVIIDALAATDTGATLTQTLDRTYSNPA